MARRVLNFLYNLDRAFASLGGAPPQETISSEVGRNANSNWLAKQTRWALDKIQPLHTEHAVEHADRLDAADDGQEK